MSSTIELKENDVVLCTVARIESTGVFVKLDEYPLDGAITLSEISPAIDGGFNPPKISRIFSWSQLK